MEVHAQDKVMSKVMVDRFIVSGNTLLSQTILDKALAAFKGERSLEELKQAALLLQDLYREAGYGAVIVYVPVQTGAPGEAAIAVLEGRLARLVVTGNKQFSEANILRSLPALTQGRSPQVFQIDAQIQLANESQAKQVAVSLETGQRQGEVDANVVVTELAPQRWNVRVDNTGNANTGRLRANLGYQHGALWDLDHALSLQFQFAPEKLKSVAVFSAGYRVPLYSMGMSLDAFLGHSNVDGGSTGTAAGPLQFSGKGEIAGLRLSKQLLRMNEIDQKLALGLDRRAYLNDCSIAGLPAGACGAAGASVTVHPLSLEYSAQKQGENFLGLVLSLSHNLALGGAHGSVANFEAVRAGARRAYTLAKMSFNFGMSLPAQWQLQARGSAQFSPHALVLGEQFGIGGAGSVRGYEERESLGDSGMAASLELHGPDLSKRVSDKIDGLRFLGFADLGRVKNQFSTPCDGKSSRCSIGSWGFGARLGAGPLQLRLDAAQALKAANQTANKDWRLHFQASYSFV